MPRVVIERPHDVPLGILLPLLQSRIAAAAAERHVKLTWHRDGTATASGFGFSAHLKVGVATVRLVADLGFALIPLTGRIKHAASRLIEKAILEAGGR